MASPNSNGDGEMARRLHHDLNDNPSRATGVITREVNLMLMNSGAAPQPTPKAIASQSLGDQTMPDAPSQEVSSPEFPDNSPSDSPGIYRNDSAFQNQAVHGAKATGVKRNLDALDSGDSVSSDIADSDEVNQGETIDASDLGPPRKRRATRKRTTGYIKYYQTMQKDKPEPFGKPPVWADKRQNLCETLPWYKAYMSGAYLQDRVAVGFMVDKEVGPRDKFDEEIIIARVGGGRSLDMKTGKMIQTKDQNESTIGLGFQRAKDEQRPVGMIAGQGNSICPSKLPHYYNVLDWFHVTDVWCEKYNGIKCWMVRVEKIHLSNKSWWAPTNSPLPDPYRDVHAFRTTSLCCNVCNKSSKQIYKQGWTCLETSCRKYFEFTPTLKDELLDYNEAFMKERTIFNARRLPPLVPRLISSGDADEMGAFGYEIQFKRGIVCPLCQGCSRRIDWRQWTCESPGCPFTHKIRQDIISVHDAISAGFLQHKKEICNEDFGVRRRQQTLGLYDITEFVIPGPQPNEVAGIIRHFKANGIINAQPNGPNHLFRQMQREEFNLRRHPARQKGNTGEVLTSHWASNWGAPYKYGVSVLSKGFDEAPSAIIRALKRLTWAGEQTVTDGLEPFHAFNELLSVGYFEESSIGYHDDGEKELGPTVATLSLGANAIMSLRPKAKCGLGPKSKNAKGTKLDILQFKIRHGDIVIMHGSGIQKSYEHAVTPDGKLRFALTCRYVRPELMANDGERQQAEIKGRLPDNHEMYSYNGETESPTLQEQESEHLLNAQRAIENLAVRAHLGELSVGTMRACRRFFNELADSMAPLDSHLTNDI